MLPDEENLQGVTEQEYGYYYRDHFFSIYTRYVEMADRISARRQSANSFFLSINTAVIAFSGYTSPVTSSGDQNIVISPIAIAGIILCYLWYRLIVSYKDLNSAKFKLICQMERELPLKPYDAEWKSLGKGTKPKIHIPFSRLEMIIPFVFMLLHASFLIFVFGISRTC